MFRISVPLLICFVVVCAVGCKRDGADLSSPKSAAMAFGKAMDVGDAETAKAASTGGDPRLVAALARSSGSLKKLHDAAVMKFGAEGETLLAHGEATPVDYEKPIADSDVEMDGDSAVMTCKADTSTPLKLKKVDGLWKVDIGSFKGIADLAPMVPAMEAVNAANDALAADIAAGKYATVADAEKAKTAMTLSAINANGGAAASSPDRTPGGK